MSELKCPICGEKIEHIEDGWCNCKNRCLGSGSISLWQELIRIRKALEIAVDGIKYMRNNCLEYAADYMDKAAEVLEQITAEQKDIK